MGRKIAVSKREILVGQIPTENSVIERILSLIHVTLS